MAKIGLGRIGRSAISTVGENMRPQFGELAADGGIRIVWDMFSQYDLVNYFTSFDYFESFRFRHKNEALLFSKPVIVIDYDGQLVSQLFSFFEHSYMSDMQWIKPSGYGDYILFSFHFR